MRDFIVFEVDIVGALAAAAYRQRTRIEAEIINRQIQVSRVLAAIARTAVDDRVGALLVEPVVLAELV